MASRLSRWMQRLAAPFRRVVDAYLLARYGTDNNLTALRAAIAQLRQ